MSLKRIVFVVEFIAIVVPSGVMLWLFGVMVLQRSLHDGLPRAVPNLLLITVLVIPFLCGLWLSVRYLARGAESLARANKAWWWGVGVGALIPVSGFIVYLARLVFGNFAIARLPASMLELLVLAVPLLLPLFHLWAERKAAAARS